MKEVLGDVLADHVAFLEERGIALERWLGPDPVPERRAEVLRDRRSRVDWQHFAPLCDSYWALLEPLNLNETFADYLIAKPDGWAARHRSIFAMAVSPKLLITVVIRISGIAAFRCLKGTVRTIGPNEVRILLKTNVGYAPCESLFRYTGMALERLPRLLNLPEAVVESVITPTHCEYHVRLPPHRVGFWQRVRSFFRYLRGATVIFSELSNRETELKQNYDALLKAQAELSEAHRVLEQRVAERTQDFLQAKEEAEAANQAKTAFLANVSHELRTPLASILGYTELLEARGHEEDQRRYALEVVSRNGRQLLSLVNDLLDISRIESDGMQLLPLPIDVRSEVRDVAVSLAEQAAKRYLNLRVEVSPSVPATITTDATRFRQILTNVIINAIKFSEAGTIDVRVAMQDDLVCVEVEDHGLGIAPDLHEQIFQPFVQANPTPAQPRGGGAGLGLTISRRLARALGGDLILLRSAPGQGSVFAFTVRQALEATP